MHVGVHSHTWFAAFLAALILDPGGAVGLKYGASLVVLLVTAVHVNKVILPADVLTIEVLLFAVAPAAILFVAIAAYGVPVGQAASQVTFLATWVVFPFLTTLPRRRIVRQFERAITWGAAIVVCTFVGLFVLHVLDRTDLIAEIHQASEVMRLGYIGERPIGGTAFVPNVYYRWSMLLIPGVVLLFTRDRASKWLVLVAAGLTLSAGILLFTALALILWAIFLADYGERQRAFRIVAISSLLLFGWVWVHPIDLDVLEKFTTQSASTMQKMGHLSSIAGIFGQHPLQLFIGTGLGSQFFSIGVYENVVNVEVSHADLVRQFGALYALAFITYVFTVMYRLVGTDRPGKALSIGLLSQFLCAGTNPLLLSPVFFITLVIARVYLVRFTLESEGPKRLCRV